jgi:hypothetical protein
MKIKKISFRPLVREHEKGVFLGYANIEIEFAPDVSQTLYNVELTVWDDNGFAIRTPRHQAKRNSQWYTDCFLSEKLRRGIEQALRADDVINTLVAIAEARILDAVEPACENLAQEKEDIAYPF